MVSIVRDINETRLNIYLTLSLHPSPVRQPRLHDAHLGDRRQRDPELSHRRAPAALQEHRALGRQHHVPRLQPPTAARRQATGGRQTEAQRGAQSGTHHGE